MPRKPTGRKPGRPKKDATRTKTGSQRRAVKPDKIDENTPLLVTERLYADEYLLDLNQTKAAIRAGYSPKSAANTATHLMKQPNVAAYIARKLAEQSTRTGIEFERNMRELARIAFVNPLRVMDPLTGNVVVASDDDAAAIAGIKHKPGEWGIEREIKFHAKDKALDLLLKYNRIGAEFEAKMALEREKIAMQREQLEIEKRRLAMQEAVAAQEKDGFNKILNILDPFGEQHQPMPNAGFAGEIPEADNKSTSEGGT